MKQFSVCIVGCGNIAGGYDLLQPDEALPLGHAKAFIRHGGFKIAACVDPNSDKLLAFQNRWEVPQGFARLSDVTLHTGQFDVICICSPSGFHGEDIQAALALQPRLIFCEKPLAMSLFEAQKANINCIKKNVLLAVNYSRRWYPQVIELKKQLAQMDWGSVRSVSAVYNKGLLNNGSHMIDLLINLLGPLQLTFVGRPVFDYFDIDPSIDACFQTEAGVPIQLNLAHAQDYELFEMEIVTEHGVINMEDSGSRWRMRKAEPSAHLPGYSLLNFGKWLENQGSYALTGAVANLYDVLIHGNQLACTGNHALQVQALCEQIQHRALTSIVQN